MEYKINTKLKTLDKIINFFTFKKSERVKGYCGHCGNTVFKLDNKWYKIGLCTYCWEMIDKKKKSGYAKAKSGLKKLKKLRP